MKKLFAFSLCALVTTAGADDSATTNLQDMVSPISHPVTFEDPRHSTEVRAIYAHHKFQEDFVTAGGDVNVYALQARFKVSEDFSIIATKDGIVDLNPDAVVPDDTGIANIALGGKYSVYQDDHSIYTAGLRYEIPLGDEDVLQGEGDGNINPFFSMAYTACGFNFIAGSGLRVRMDDEDSSFWDLDLHADYKIGNFYPTVELGLIKVINDGERLPIPDEGYDFFNLGASGAAGRNIVTMSLGGRYRVMDDLDLGIAYEFPLDRGTGARAIDWRLTADLIFRFSLT